MSKYFCHVFYDSGCLKVFKFWSNFCVWIIKDQFRPELTNIFRNGSDSGHGTHSSTSRHEIENLTSVWNESPRLGFGKRYEDTINSRKSSHHSVYNYNQSSTANFQRNGIGEYAQIDILPVGRQNYDLRKEPIYESIDHAKHWVLRCYLKKLYIAR